MILLLMLMVLGRPRCHRTLVMPCSSHAVGCMLLLTLTIGQMSIWGRWLRVSRVPLLMMWLMNRLSFGRRRPLYSTPKLLFRRYVVSRRMGLQMMRISCWACAILSITSLGRRRFGEVSIGRWWHGPVTILLLTMRWLWTVF